LQPFLPSISGTKKKNPSVKLQSAAALPHSLSLTESYCPPAPKRFGGTFRFRIADGSTLLTAGFGLFGHLMTRSARAKTFGGIVRSICLAAFRFMMNSNFFGCSTGRLADRYRY
jgi:hypothetical protein